MRSWKRFSLLALLSLASCGYRWEPDYPHAKRPSVTVPFVEGDEDGTLTAEVIRTLASSGLVDVISFGGDYDLRVSIAGSSADNIGFREDPQKIDGKVRKSLLACEGRRTMTIQASLFQGDEIAYGPYEITTEAEYDYVDGDSIQDLTFTNPSGQFVTVLPFSLGQLESVESAQEAAGRPLYSRLAQKIVDAISAEW